MAKPKPNKKFAFFDEFEIYKEMHSNLQNNPTKLMPAEQFYQIWTPFMMDSQLANYLSDAKHGGNEKKSKRKRHKTCLIRAEFLEKTNIVQAAHQEFQSAYNLQKAGQNVFPSSDLLLAGNKKAREWVRNAPEYSQTPFFGDDDEIIVVEINQQMPSTSQPNPILYRNSGSRFVLANSFLIPPNCSYLLGNVSLLKQFPRHGLTNFDFILMDPPWQNKTVKRQKTYKLLRRNDVDSDIGVEQIRQIPLPALLRADGLLCIWVTNSRAANQTALALLEHWNLMRVAEWHWLKVTKSGEPVYQFRPEHKVPFENILFACKPEAIDKFSTIPDNFCFISVPNANPSRKPPVSILLEQLGHLEPVQNGLELFARSLLPNFTSIGFEVTKFQHEYFFEQSITV